MAKARAAQRRVRRTPRPTYGRAVHQYPNRLIVEQPKQAAETAAGNKNEGHCAILADVIEAVGAFRLLHDLVTKIPARMHWQNRLLARGKIQLACAIVSAR